MSTGIVMETISIGPPDSDGTDSGDEKKVEGSDAHPVAARRDDAESEEADQKLDVWTCAVCTLENEGGDECNACGQMRPGQQDIPPPPQTAEDINDEVEWACEGCTLVNLGGNFCAVCESDRPASTYVDLDKVEGEELWHCPSCTLANTADECTICLTKKPRRIYNGSQPGQPAPDTVVQTEPLVEESPSAEFRRQTEARQDSNMIEPSLLASLSDFNATVNLKEKEIEELPEPKNGRAVMRVNPLHPDAESVDLADIQPPPPPSGPPRKGRRRKSKPGTKVVRKKSPRKKSISKKVVRGKLRPGVRRGLKKKSSGAVAVKKPSSKSPIKKKVSKSPVRPLSSKGVRAGRGRGAKAAVRGRGSARRSSVKKPSSGARSRSKSKGKAIKASAKKTSSKKKREAIPPPPP